MIETNVLECSSKGDKRFSAFFAWVTLYGKNANIETHYQSCKRFNDAAIDKVKGKQPDYIVINGKELDKKYLTPYYKLLWVKYLDMHPDLVEYATKFDDFHDIFKGKNTINCQADVVRQYIKQGRKSIMEEELVKEFIKELKSEIE